MLVIKQTSMVKITAVICHAIVVSSYMPGRQHVNRSPVCRICKQLYVMLLVLQVVQLTQKFKLFCAYVCMYMCGLIGCAVQKLKRWALCRHGRCVCMRACVRLPVFLCVRTHAQMHPAPGGVLFQEVSFQDLID